MNEKLEQEIEKQFTYFSDGAEHVPVVKLLHPEFRRVAEHFYNLALADVRDEIEKSIIALEKVEHLAASDAGKNWNRGYKKAKQETINFIATLTK